MAWPVGNIAVYKDAHVHLRQIGQVRIWKEQGSVIQLGKLLI